MQKDSLQRSLGLTSGILLVSGLMIGTGVFKKVAPMAAAGISGFNIVLAWSVAGLVTLLGAFTYAGLSLVTKETGGVYEYLRLAFGNFVAFLYGWTVFMIIGSGSIAALSFIFFQSANALVHLPEPLGFLNGWEVGHTHPFANSGIKMFSVLLIFLLTWINTRGVKQGGNLNNLLTIIKVGGILLLVISGLIFAWHHPLGARMMPNTPTLTGFNLLSAFFGAMLSALYAYEGWANITFITGEMKRPERNVPLAIIGGVGLVMLLYVLLNYTFLQVISVSNLARMSDNAIAGVEMARVVFGSIGSALMAVLIMISGFGALNACIIVFARVYFRMAEEKAFFRQAAQVHPRFKTPAISLYISAAWCSVLVITGSFEMLSNMVTLTGFLFFGLCSLSLIKLKKKKMITAKVTGYPVAPLLILGFCVALLIITLYREPLTSLVSLGLTATAVPFYFYFRRQDKYKSWP